MAFQVVPDVAEVVMKFRGVSGGIVTGSQAECTFFVRDTVIGWGSGSLVDLGNFFKDWWNTGKQGGAAAKTTVADDWVLEEIDARDLGSETGASVTVAVANTGTRSGQAVPPSVPILVRYAMDPGTFPKKGRVFWPGGVEGDLDGTFFAGAFTVEVKGIFDDLNAGLSDTGDGGLATWAQVRISRSSGTEVPENPKKVAIRRDEGLSNTIANITVREEVGSQRDRRPSD